MEELFSESQLKNMSPKNLERPVTSQKLLDEKVGCQAYHNLPKTITVTGCLAHARRCFGECLTTMEKEFTKEQVKETTAYRAMVQIGMLYKIEGILADKAPRLALLQKHQRSQRKSHCIQHNRDRNPEWPEAIRLSNLCAGKDEGS